MKKNKIIRAIIIAVCLLLVLSQVLIIFASSEKKALVTNEIMFSIYNNTSSEYIVSNTKIDVESDTTLLSLFDKLKEEKIIKNYSEQDKSILSVTAIDETTLQAGTPTTAFTFRLKLNGSITSKEQMSNILKNGDIVELVFTSEPITTSQQSLTTSQSSEPTHVETNAQWNSELSKVLNTGFDWLNRNLSTSSSYLMVAGAIEKTADIKMMNTFINSVSQAKEYANAIEISKDILSLTFCGLDASSDKYNRLVQNLYNYKDIMKQGIFGAVNALTAYDCNNYDVAENAINSRTILVDTILTYQNEDGGFPVIKGSKSDIDATAMTITALSVYLSRSDVTASVGKALSYLSEQQTIDGFGFMGKANLESLCTVIIALNSLNIPLDDERFAKGELTLIENLMQYQNSDGGFAHIIGNKSTTMPTEQALIALTSIKRDSNPYILAKPIEKDKTVSHDEEASTIFRDDSTIYVIIGTILAIISIATLIYLIKTKEKKKSKQR